MRFHSPFVTKAHCLKEGFSYFHVLRVFSAKADTLFSTFDFWEIIGFSTYDAFEVIFESWVPTRFGVGNCAPGDPRPPGSLTWLQVRLCPITGQL